MKLTKEIQEKLQMPFDETEVKFKPNALKDGKALALAYVDARTIFDRLDDVVGVENWQDEYEVISPKQVLCKLTIMGVTKSDAGEAQEDDKEPLKSSVSDAIKRAAVKFGIGRYLYRLPKTWCRYDNAKKAFSEVPDFNSNSSETGRAKESRVQNPITSTNSDEDVPIPECASCKEKITNRVAIFSKKYYQRPLCMKCQNNMMQEKEAEGTKETAASQN